MRTIGSYVITRPTTALRILKRVVRLIKEEPKRLRMGTWDSWQNDYIPMACSRAMPTCGTVGCIDGWIRFVAGHPFSNPMSSAGLIFPECCGAGYKELMYSFTNGQTFFAADGTSKQARLAVEFLEGLMSSYRRELQQTIVTPKPSERLPSDSSKG